MCRALSMRILEIPCFPDVFCTCIDAAQRNFALTPVHGAVTVAHD
jgi:hypothetical protein